MTIVWYANIYSYMVGLVMESIIYMKYGCSKQNAEHIHIFTQ